MKDPSPLLAQAVSSFCEARFAEVAGVASRSLGPLSSSVPSRRDLAIEEHCLALLSALDPPLAGAGVVIAPRLFAEDPYWLEWWVAGADAASRPGRLAVDLNPNSVAFRDYTTSAWFAEPRRTGARTVTGPYVDYLCTDQYTLTFTTPLMAEGRFLGVAGVDVLARWFEQRLFTVADRAGVLDVDCVVVNRTGRVVACPSGSWMTGDLVRTLATREEGREEWQVTECPGTPFVVARPTV